MTAVWPSEGTNPAIHGGVGGHTSRRTGQMPVPSRRQDGIVLIVALIVMVALSLAGVALVRSVDTTTAVVGNLAFRQAALLPANLAVEEASAALFKDVAKTGVALIADKTADLPAQNYFASFQPEDPTKYPHGVPDQLKQLKNYTLPRVLYADKDNYFEVRYMIERSCTGAGPALPGNCDMMAPKQVPGTTVGEGAPPVLPQIPFYRLTVRVDGPKNTTAFLQAMLR